MSKVGILSMQRIFNYGSFLQALGLKLVIQELGGEVEFVDYHEGECLIPSRQGYGVFRKIEKALEVMKYKTPWHAKISYIKHKKTYASRFFPYLGITEDKNYSPELDLLVIGSDEVFNCIQDNTNVGFSPELFGVDSRAKKTISYAASFGNTTMEKLEQFRIDNEIGTWFGNFNAISVRDKNSGHIIKTLVGKEPEYHLDPVLIYDFIGKCKEIPETVPEKNYILLYGYSGRFTINECNDIRRYADFNHLKVICVGGVQNCCDRFVDCSPFEILAYFKNANKVITDTFHGTIMSVITQRQFVTLIRQKGYGNFEKLKDLLNRLELQQRALEDTKYLPDVIIQPIDYEYVNTIVAKERKITYEYLKRQISH